jgi:hypothetical protein
MSTCESHFAALDAKLIEAITATRFLTAEMMILQGN